MINSKNNQDSYDNRGKNPNHVVISIFSPEDVDHLSSPQGYADHYTDNGFIYDIYDYHDNKDLCNITKIIESHIKKYGSIERIIIAGHGEVNLMHVGGTHNTPSESFFYIKDFLSEIYNLNEKFGYQTVKEQTIFTGCRGFSNFSDYNIRYYNYEANELCMKITGNEFIGFGGEKPDNMFVSFIPMSLPQRNEFRSEYRNGKPIIIKDYESYGEYANLWSDYFHSDAITLENYEKEINYFLPIEDKILENYIKGVKILSMSSFPNKQLTLEYGKHYNIEDFTTNNNDHIRAPIFYTFDDIGSLLSEQIMLFK